MPTESPVKDHATLFRLVDELRNGEIVGVIHLDPIRLSHELSGYPVLRHIGEHAEDEFVVAVVVHMVGIHVKIGRRVFWQKTLSNR